MTTQIEQHFEANMLDGEKVVEGRSMLEAKHVLEYIKEYYILQPTEEREVKVGNYCECGAMFYGIKDNYCRNCGAKIKRVD